mgnify:CR=1 FL=1
MIGIPPGTRSAYNFTIFCLGFADQKPPELHCFAYDGGGRNDWLWSTAIVEETIKQHEIEGVTHFTFTTKSGSSYSVSHPANFPPTHTDHLVDWFKAATITPVERDQWLEIVKSKEGTL